MYDKKDLTFMLSVFQERRKKSELEKTLKEIMAANFPNLIRDINLEIQEAEQTSNRINS